MTRIVIVGDTHLQHAHPRNGDRLQAFDQVIREGLAVEHLGAWVHVGDVFHQRSTPEDRNAVAERFQQMADAAPLIVIYGNHCSPLDLHVFARLRAAHPVCVLDRPECLYLRLATGERATVFGLPFPNKHGLVSSGVAPGDVQDVATDLLDPVFMVAGDTLATARAHGDVTLMVGHATIAGSVSSIGQPMGMHGEIVVTAGHLARLGTTPKIFGHVHKPQEVHGAYYVGSICRMDFGEREEKRSLVVEYDGATVNIVSHPIDVAPMFHVTGLLTREGFALTDADEDIHRRVADHDWAGCDVRCRFSYKASERAVLDESIIRALFSSALRLKVESIAVPDRELRAPEVAAAKTLPAKLAAYRKVEQLEPSIAEKLDALERLEPAAVLARVAETMRAIEARESVSVAA